MNPAHAISFGGYFHYMSALVAGLRQFDDLQVSVFYDDPAFEEFRFESPNFNWVRLRKNGDRIGRIVRAVGTAANLRVPWVGRFEVLREHELDCVVTPASLVAFHLDIPFVGIIFDVMYKYYPECSEYTLRERASRDAINSKLTKHAAVTVVDSDMGRDDVVRFFRGNADKITPVPLCAPPHVYGGPEHSDSFVAEIASRYDLPPRFLFYPAQMWEHKNHVRLLDALILLKRECGMEVPTVFVGSASAAGDVVLRRVRELGLDETVRYLGYVPDAEVVAMYRRATALIYPSFADYTNIPVLEAMVLGTPVLCANVFAMPQQVGDAGLLFDPFDVREMALQIRRVWTDEELRRDLILRGRDRAATLSIETFGRRWRGVIIEAIGATCD